MLVEQPHIKKFAFSGKSKFWVINKNNGAKMAISVWKKSIYVYKDARFLPSNMIAVGTIIPEGYSFKRGLDSSIINFFSHYLEAPDKYPEVVLQTYWCGRCGRILKKESSTGLGPLCSKL